MTTNLPRLSDTTLDSGKVLDKVPDCANHRQHMQAFPRLLPKVFGPRKRRVRGLWPRPNPQRTEQNRILG